MTMRGTLIATAVLFAITLATSIVGWNMVDPNSGVGGLVLVAVLGGFAIGLALRFRPMWAPFLAPVYAVIQGLFVGSISHVYNNAYGGGIVIRAVGATFAVFLVMLAMYATGVLKVTDRLRKTITAATLGLMLFYGVSLILGLFGVEAPFINDASPIGIAFSALAAGLAAFNLALDFDVVDRGVKGGAPKYFEWYAGFGLLVTVVWLYLEILRLLGKLQRR
jgi:uncharacterized YccA/Bax inhibitor family protein